AAETGQAYDESKERFYEEFIYGDYRGADLRGYALDLPRLYVIVSSGTASASEAVVNALRGIGLEVVLVGQKTNGKKCGDGGCLSGGWSVRIPLHAGLFPGI
ncbi:protein containing Peptidase S41 domain protein, partial [human gut metagenome]